MSWVKPCASLTQSRIRISAEKRKPKDWAWLIFYHTQLVHSLAVPDSSFCTSVQMGRMALVFANPLFLLFFFWLLKDKHWHFPQERKSLCSTKERIKGSLRNDLGSSTTVWFTGKRVPCLSAAWWEQRVVSNSRLFCWGLTFVIWLEFPQHDQLYSACGMLTFL